MIHNEKLKCAATGEVNKSAVGARPTMSTTVRAPGSGWAHLEKQSANPVWIHKLTPSRFFPQDLDAPELRLVFCVSV